MRTLLLLLAVVSPLLAAPVPGDTDKPKPRPKLVGTLALPVQVSHPLWLPDGKHLILRCGDGVARVIRRDQFGDDEPTVKPVAEFKLPTNTTRLDLSPDGAELYTVTSAGGKLTAESRAHFWTLKRVLEGKDLAKPDRVVSLEMDAVGFGTLIGGGKHLLVPVIEARKAAVDPNQQPGGFGGPGGGWGGEGGFSGRLPTEYTARFERVSAKTGDVAGEVVKYDDGNHSYASHTVDAKANRLFVQLHTADETVVRCVNLTTGKQEWERKLEGKPQRNMAAAPVPSPDGGFLAVNLAQMIGRPVGGPQGARGGRGAGGPVQMSYTARGLPALLNAKTGEQVPLSADDVTGAQLFDFTADGRLLVGQISKDTGVSQVVVWETKTGKVVKVWNGRGDVTFAFAPTGHELLAVERETKYEYGPRQAFPQGQDRNGGQAWTTTQEVTRTEYKSTLGVWELSPLAK